MFARIGWWEGSPEELDRWSLRSRNEVKPAVQAQAGALGAYWLLDRSGGRALTLTLWQSEEAMRASDEAAHRIQRGTIAASGAAVTTSWYEVVDWFQLRDCC